ncbi:MAG: hypothetical protein NVS9B1_02670 [Candidatus Dormibacteraceae bacterium]
MAEETGADSAPKRRTRRTAGTRTTRSVRTTRTPRATTATRRRATGGAELVENLNSMVDQLIKENRKLKRQLDKLTTKGTAAASGTLERGLKTIQRRVQKALGGGTTTRRRSTREAGTATTRRATTTRRRRTTGTDTTGA